MQDELSQIADGRFIDETLGEGGTCDWGASLDQIHNGARIWPVSSVHGLNPPAIFQGAAAPAPRKREKSRPAVVILGTRGIPARHGGFETFAENLALHLQGSGWDVTVACQADSHRPSDTWRGVRRTFYSGIGRGELASIVFDGKSVVSAAWTALKSGRNRPLILTLGYNTAIFGLLFSLLGIKNVVNMDGVEWKRKKWSRAVRLWFWLNEHIAARLSDHMIADHPAIAAHLMRHSAREKISVIPYGAHAVHHAPATPLKEFGLTPGEYALIVARPVPENSILEMVEAYSRKPRNRPLVVLGDFHPENSGYHAAVMRAAGPGVLFLGAIYEQKTLDALRSHARLYLHGHTVGGTNPSLVEALGAGMPVLAHDNVYNRWVAGSGGRYFNNLCSCADQLDELMDVEPEADAVIQRMRAASKARFSETFTWPVILSAYERLLLDWGVAKQRDRLLEPMASGALELAN